MKRHEFFTALGVTAGTVIFAPFLVSCSKSNSVADPGTGGTPGTIDFTLDLSLPANSALMTVGGSLANNGIIIAFTSSGYVALANVCTHQGRRYFMIAQTTVLIVQIQQRDMDRNMHSMAPLLQDQHPKH